MSMMAPQITSLTIVYSIVYSDADQRKHQSSASLAFVRGIHRRPVNSPHKWPVTRKMFPFDDIIMNFTYLVSLNLHYEIDDVIFNGWSWFVCIFSSFCLPMETSWPCSWHKLSLPNTYTLQHVVGWESLCTCIVMHCNVWLDESIRALAVWCHDWDINHQNHLIDLSSAICHVNGRKFSIRSNVNVVKNMSI